MNSVLVKVVDAIHSAAQLDTLSRIQNRSIAASECSDDFVPASALPPFMIAIGSVAGAGKTTLSAKIALEMNERAKKTMAAVQSHQQLDEEEQLLQQQQQQQQQQHRGKGNNYLVTIHPVFVLPMDGYHHYRSELEKMPDPEQAFRRRGAPYTFNSQKYFDDVSKLRREGYGLSFPAFEHETMDPQENAIPVDGRSRWIVMPSRGAQKQPNDVSVSSLDVAAAAAAAASSQQQRSPPVAIIRPVVIVEGIYALYADAPEDDERFPHWAAARSLFDMFVYLRISIDLATERLTRRHMRCWGISEKQARERAAGSDRDNGLLVIAAAEALMQEEERQNSGDKSETGVKRFLTVDSIEDEGFVK